MRKIQRKYRSVPALGCMISILWYRDPGVCDDNSRDDYMGKMVLVEATGHDPPFAHGIGCDIELSGSHVIRRCILSSCLSTANDQSIFFYFF